ncbi:serine hydrolase domain-containing protein [Brevibacillus brevis]|uniref:serine hydrolase domain-containing protein n=1 Tax=Brevibacillus brevis TaxID=1393 RepID=UPI00165DF0B7|nr:serine hydrolase domain-containing protein [Brevibacillus brevis]
MNTRNQIAFASLALLLTGASLFNNMPASIVKAESAQNVSSPLVKKGQRDQALKQAMEESLKFGFPGILAVASENGKSRAYVVGVADKVTKKQMEADYRFRIGSVTKTFTAATVLHIVGEGRLNLDDSIEKWLPGVIQGNGYDGKQITIRQILNHTSGLTDYLKSPDFDMSETKKSHTPEELVKLGLTLPPEFKPGKSWSYSNTGYVILGMLIERVTGNSYEEEMEKRIIEPLKLSNTFLPGNSRVIPGINHARGYGLENEAGELKDVTYYNPSIASSAGDMISTADDLNKFFSALLGGKLLKEEQLKQMLTSVPTGTKEMPNGYGLGIYQTKLKNGVSVWGHSGRIPGFSTIAGGTLGGKHTLAANINYMGETDVLGSFYNILQAEFGE